MQAGAHGKLIQCSLIPSPFKLSQGRCVQADRQVLRGRYAQANQLQLFGSQCELSSGKRFLVAPDYMRIKGASANRSWSIMVYTKT